MVQVIVSGRLFNLTSQQVKGSHTIENLLQYVIGNDNNNTKELFEPVHLGINLQSWIDYMNFLYLVSMSSGDDLVHVASPNSTNVINALHVIDYLDNTSQLRMWYDLVYYGNVTLANIKLLLNSTNFTLGDIDPFFVTTTIDQMLPYIFDVTELPHAYIDHIIHTLFDDKTYDGYLTSLTCPEYNEIWKISRSDIRSKLEYSDSKIVMIKYDTLTTPSIYRVSRYVNLTSSDFSNNIPKPQIISPRIAAHYLTHPINNSNNFYYVVDGDGKQKLVTCQHPNPYLKKYTDRINFFDDSDSESDELDLQSGKVTYKDFKYYCSDMYCNIPAISKLQVTGNYKPFVDGYATTYKIRDYDLLSYNKPSLYERDYYLFLVYEIDPISKIFYAFCV